MRGEADLHDYQRMAVEFLWEHPRSALFADVGLGKAIMSLTVLSRVLMDLDSGPALVVAPIRVAKQTWPTEIAEWAHVNWIDHTLVRAEDGDPDVKAVFDRYRLRFHEVAKALGVPPAVRGKTATSFALPFRDAFKKERRRVRANSCNPLHLIGIEQLEWLVEHHGRNWPYRTVVIDESSKFKDYSTNRFKAMNSVYKKVERMHLLTASPAPETYMDLFAQMYLLDRGERLGRRITHYRQEHFNHDEYTRSYELKAGHDTKISEKISDICLVMKAEDYLPLDKPNMLVRHIELDDETIALYDQFVETFVLSLPEAEIEALNGGSLINKLLQFTGGAVYDENKEVHEVHDDKLDDLRQLIDEIDTPLMVAYWYQSSLKRLRKAFPNAVVMDKAGKCVDAWNRGEIPLLLIHPACLHPSTEVLTEHRGWRKIVDVKSCERVHDGVEFVSHSGCSFSGVRDVIEVFGITLTPNHKLLVHGEWVEAKNVRDSGTTAREASYPWWRFADRSAREMHDVRRETDNGEAECNSRERGGAETLSYLLSNGRAPYDRNSFPQYLARYAKPCDQSRASRIFPLRGRRSGHFGRLARLQEFLSGYVRHVCRWFDDRSSRQCVRLLQRELCVDYDVRPAVAQNQYPSYPVPGSAYAPGRVLPTGGYVSWGSDSAAQQGVDGRRDGCGLRVVDVPEGAQVSPVYDLVDCGPRNRFLIRNAKGEVFVSHNSAGHGLNMQKGPGHDLAFFDLCWSRELYEQIIGRLARQGQKKVVRVWHLVVRRRQTGAKLTKRQAEDAMTADEIVMQALADKGAGQDRLFRLIRDIRARAKLVKPDIDSEDDL